MLRDSLRHAEIPHIVVLDGHTLNPWDEVAALGRLTVHDHTPADQIVKRAADAEIALTNKTQMNAATLAQLPSVFPLFPARIVHSKMQ